MIEYSIADWIHHPTAKRENIMFSLRFAEKTPKAS